MTLLLQTPVEFLNVSAAVSGMTIAEQVAYENGLAAPTTIVNLDGAGLHIAWDVMRTRSSKTDFGEVTIRNLSPAFRRQLFVMWKTRTASAAGFKTGIHIGWGGEVNLVMSGDVWEMLPEIRSGEDVLTTMRFGEGQRQVKDSTTPTPKQYNYEAGNALGLWLTIQDMFFQLGGLRIDPSMQAVFTTAVTATPIAASGSWLLSGEIVDNINDLLDTFGLEWKVYNGQVIFMSRGITASSQGAVAVLLTPTTGLLEWMPADDAGIVCTALAQPSVRPGTQFIVQDGFGVPVGAPGFRVETVRFTGQTDSDSLMFLTGRRSIPI